jgi:beta-lactamase class D
LIGYLLGKLFEFLFGSDDDDDEKERPSRKRRMRRVFISHSWDQDKDYRTLIRNFNNYGFEYYNHSIPEEKALDLDEETTRNIENGIRNKIKGCSKVLVLAGNYANNFWIKKEVKIAAELGKEIIAIKPWNATSIPPYLKNQAHKIVGFNAKTIIEIIKN